MRIELFITTLFFQSFAWSQALTVDQCKSLYLAIVPSAASATAQTYCASKVSTLSSTLNACIDIKKTNMSTQANYNSSVQSQFSKECQAILTGQQQAQSQQQLVAQQQAAAAAAQAAKAASSSGGGGGRAQEAAAIITGGAAAYQMYVNRTKDADKKKDPNSALANAIGQAATQPPAKAADDNKKPENTSANTSTDTKPTQAQASTTEQKPATEQQSANRVVESYGPADSNALENTTHYDGTVDLGSLSQNVKTEGADLINSSPDMADTVKAVTDMPTSPEGLFAKTEITNAAQVKEKQLRSINADLVQINQLIGVAGLFPVSIGHLNKINADVNSYVTNLKPSCTNKAETTHFVCAEDTSLGIKAVNFMMNEGSVVLGLISSAQKSCSTTSKLTKLASTGLTIAKTVCVGAKVMCDTSCKSAVADISKLQLQLQNLQDQILLEAQKATVSFCGNPSSQPCIYANKAIASVPALINTVNLKITSELKPDPGTAQFLSATCDSTVKDIAFMATNIAGLLTANKSAKDCEAKLSTNAVGPQMTTAQFCEMQANANSKQCECQRNPTATGCVGSFASTSTNKNNELGSQISATKGASGFASIGVNKSATGSGVGSLNAASNLKDNDLARSGQLSGSNSAGGLGASLTTGSDVAGSAGQHGESADLAKKNEDKKWGFGAFESLGGFFGGSKNSSGSTGSSRDLKSNQQEAIKRKIASDQFAAEVSTASGKSNWEKVRQMYMMKERSFLNGQ